MVISLSDTFTTLKFVFKSISSLLNFSSANWVILLSNIVRICPPASITEMFTYFFTSGYNFAKSSFTKSCNSAANSTPVGPPPIITK
uniref:Pco100812 n=1 Tax=Arundo donax TaxID=35708 RepID=A0A0A9APT3_ARUDO